MASKEVINKDFLAIRATGHLRAASAVSTVNIRAV